MILKLVPVKHTTKAGVGFENVLVVKDDYPYCMFYLEMLFEPNGEADTLYELLGRGETIEVEVRLDIVGEERYGEE